LQMIRRCLDYGHFQVDVRRENDTWVVY
jgi:hypothetical protein